LPNHNTTAFANSVLSSFPQKLLLTMDRIVLKFPTIVELVDFSLSMKVKNYEVNRGSLTILAAFSTEDIELATNEFKATIPKAD